MERPNRLQRELWLDGLKGFAILLVILGHVLSGYLDAYTFPEEYWSFYGLRSWIYSFHMPLFFLISGFTFTLAYWREDGLRRSGFFRQLFNLFWIYVVFAGIQWGVKQAVPELVNETYDLMDLKRMLVEPLGNFWYLYVLFVLYALGALLRIPKWHPRWLLLLGGIAVAAADYHLDWTALTLYRVLYHFFFFVLGSVLCRHRELLENRQIMGVSAMVLAVAIYFYYGWGVWRWYANWRFFIALSQCMLFLGLFWGVDGLGRWLPFRLCGKYCLELYLLHTFLTAGLRTLLPMVGLTDPWGSVLVNFFLSTAVSLGVAALASRWKWMDILFRPARLLQRLRQQKTR